MDRWIKPVLSTDVLLIHVLLIFFLLFNQCFINPSCPSPCFRSMSDRMLDAGAGC